MIYEYECNKCKNIMEIRHSISAPTRKLLYCRICRRMRSVTRLISKSNFVLSSKTPWAKEGYARKNEDN